MGELEVKHALERIHANNYKLGTIDKIKDNWTQGLQLSYSYKEHWNKIKEIFEVNRLDLKDYNPILTMGALKDVKLANEISENSDDFILILHSFPIFCREKSIEEFKKWFYKNRAMLRGLRGTLKEVNQQIEKLI